MGHPRPRLPGFRQAPCAAYNLRKWHKSLSEATCACLRVLEPRSDCGLPRHRAFSRILEDTMSVEGGQRRDISCEGL